MPADEAYCSILKIVRTVPVIRRSGLQPRRSGSTGAPPFVLFKGWWFRFDHNRKAMEEKGKIPTLAKTARMGHPTNSIVTNRTEGTEY
jgi:hypothetical protein